MEKQGKQPILSINNINICRNRILREECGKPTCRVYALLCYWDRPGGQAIQRVRWQGTHRRGWHAPRYFRQKLWQFHSATTREHCEIGSWLKECGAATLDWNYSVNRRSTQQTRCSRSRCLAKTRSNLAASKHHANFIGSPHSDGSKRPCVEWRN